MKPQRQRLNLKWSIGDIDRVVEMAKRRMTAAEIARELTETDLASTPAEIAALCFEAGQFVRIGKVSA